MLHVRTLYENNSKADNFRSKPCKSHMLFHIGSFYILSTWMFLIAENSQAKILIKNFLKVLGNSWECVAPFATLLVTNITNQVSPFVDFSFWIFVIITPLTVLEYWNTGSCSVLRGTSFRCAHDHSVPSEGSRWKIRRGSGPSRSHAASSQTWTAFCDFWIVFPGSCPGFSCSL